MQAELISELYEHLARGRDRIPIFEALIGAWLEAGNMANATGVCESLLRVDPGNHTAQCFLQAAKATMSAPSSVPPLPAQSRSNRAPISSEHAAGHVDEESRAAHADPSRSFESLGLRAEVLALELQLIPEDVRCNAGRNSGDRDPVGVLELIRDGDIAGACSSRRPPAVTSVARVVLGRDDDIDGVVADILADLKLVAAWTRRCLDLDNNTPLAQGSRSIDDHVRSRLVQRKELLLAALGDDDDDDDAQSRRLAIDMAFWFVELHLFDRKFEYGETLVEVVPIREIPARYFFVTEDNHAWDLREMVSFAKAQDGGAMRNPLTREALSPGDVRRIFCHPLGRDLRRVQESQANLRLGFSRPTIDRIAALGKTLLEDQSDTIIPTMRAIGEFEAFVAQLPSAEQQAIKLLKIPATDRHTLLPYDSSIGESIERTKMNLTCSHKCGDLLTQAAAYLLSRVAVA